MVHGWQAAEAGLLAEERLYCPYAPCSALMVKGPNFGKPGKTACPHCQGCGALPFPTCVVMMQLPKLPRPASLSFGSRAYFRSTQVGAATLSVAAARLHAQPSRGRSSTHCWMVVSHHVGRACS